MIGAAYADGRCWCRYPVRIRSTFAYEPRDRAKRPFHQIHDQTRLLLAFSIEPILLEGHVGIGAHRDKAAVAEPNLNQRAFVSDDAIALLEFGSPRNGKLLAGAVDQSRRADHDLHLTGHTSVCIRKRGK
jgi:hypothetical protein